MTKIANKETFGPLRIGTLVLDVPVLLAPLAGVTDLVFRKICRQAGCALAYTEMVSAKAIFYGNEKTDLLLQTDEAEGQVAVQLFGSDPKLIAAMAQKIDHPGIALFDINMGCPVPKVFNNGEGSALMASPKKVGEIVKCLSEAVEKPITIKIRKGVDQAHINALEIAQIAEANGAAAVTIHGRTKDQYYSGKADWDIIKTVKEGIRIPVIGNGDIFQAQDALDMMAYTRCDGVMVARGARGNPWIFQAIAQLMHGEIYNGPDLEGVKSTLLEHAKGLVELKGEYVAIREMRKHIAWYVKGMPRAAKLRGLINTIDSYENVIELLHTLFN